MRQADGGRRHSSHDNTRFASCGGDRTVFLWDVATGDSLRKFTGHAGKVNAVALNGDSTVLASGESRWTWGWGRQALTSRSGVQHRLT